MLSHLRMPFFTLAMLLALAGCDSSTSESSSNAEAEVAQGEEQAVKAPELIDRSLLFGNPSRFQGRLSPDGKHMSFRAPLNGVMNIWVAPREAIDLTDEQSTRLALDAEATLRIGTHRFDVPPSQFVGQIHRGVLAQIVFRFDARFLAQRFNEF